jgi:hypothetical protein
MEVAQRRYDLALAQEAGNDPALHIGEGQREPNTKREEIRLHTARHGHPWYDADNCEAISNERL